MSFKMYPTPDRNIEAFMPTPREEHLALEKGDIILIEGRPGRWVVLEVYPDTPLPTYYCVHNVQAYEHCIWISQKHVDAIAKKLMKERPDEIPISHPLPLDTGF